MIESWYSYPPPSNHPGHYCNRQSRRYVAVDFYTIDAWAFKLAIQERQMTMLVRQYNPISTNYLSYTPLLP